MHIRKGDLVEVISGEERGRQGKVLRITKDKKRVVVDRINFVKRHKRMSKQGQPGGIVDVPAPLAVSNLALMCPKCGKKTKVRREKHEGKRKRVCKLCDEVFD
jgi:large subunit ribosomal protein L24